jgi:predicted nucleic acid-binding protein
LRYLDASAYGKLVVREPESEDLRLHLAESGRLATSLVSLVEVPRLAFRRGGPEAVGRADELLAESDIVPFDAAVQGLAREVGPPSLRALDAVHLASIIALGAAVWEAIIYDRDLTRAARHLGVRVAAPGRTTG